MSENVLHLENVTMQFGGVVAVNDLSLDVNKGEIVALIGPNGAGKTTAFNCITGVYEPTNGKIDFMGKPMVENHPQGKMRKLYAGEHAGQPAVREFTPEHIMEEPTAPTPSVPKTDLSKSAPVREFTPEHIAYEPEAPSQQNSQSVQGAQNSAHPCEFTPQHTAQEQPSQQASADTRYQYGVPKQTDDMHANSTQSRVGEVPPQCVPPVGDNAKTGGFSFSDVKGMKPNVNAGRLVGCILMDVLLWSWLIPMVVSLIFSVFVGGAFSLVTGGFTQLGNEYFNFISRIFLCCGMVSGGVLLCCAAFGLCRAVFYWIKSIVVSHVRAVYDI